jgi:hypothetical protein
VGVWCRLDLFGAVAAAFDLGEDALDAGGPNLGQRSIIPGGEKFGDCGVQFRDAVAFMSCE